MTEPGLHYVFTCPSCKGSFSILLERIPPVRARFRCLHCQQPMDFPSREEARVYASLQAQATDPPAVAAPVPPAGASASPAALPAPQAASLAAETPDGAGQRFRVEKLGFEADVFDRRGIRTLIRTGDIAEGDRVWVDEASPVAAGEVPFLKSLFKLRAGSTAVPPPRCRTHLEQLAFYQCQTTARPLCEQCAEEKKFGGTTLRVCVHCGGNVQELAPA